MNKIVDLIQWLILAVIVVILVGLAISWLTRPVTKIERVRLGESICYMTFENDHRTRVECLCR